MIKALVILSLLRLSALDHDIHVSVCDIDVNESNLEITLKTFLDDLQLAIGLTPGEEVPEDYTSADQLIEEYIRSSISLRSGEQHVKLDVDDISASNDAVWITMLATSLSHSAQQMSIRSTFLTEVYNDQTNIVNIRYNQTKKTYSLDGKKKNIIYELE